MSYTPADPYTPFFPGAVTQKPDNIFDGQDIVFQHVGPLWDEVIRTQNVLLGTVGSTVSLLGSATGSVPLTVSGISGQTANLFRARIGTTDYFTVGPAGQVAIAGSATIDGQTTIKNDVTVTAVTNLVSNFLNLSDANPTFRINKNGFMSWGVGGSTATDTTLYRTSAAFLRTDGDFLVGSNANPFAGVGVRLDNSGAIDVGRTTPDSTNVVTISGLGETTPRFGISGVGTLGWSNGSGSVDASIARSGASTLALTGSLTIGTNLTVNGKTPVYTDNAALTDARTPTGAAGGDLSGTYPNPTVKTDVALAGAPTTTTASTSDSSTKIATTAFVKNQAYATLASPTFTGTPLAPTAAVDTNSSQIANTAFVLGQAAAATPAAVGTTATATVGTSTRFARADHVHAIPSGFITSDMIQNGAIALEDLAAVLQQFLVPTGSLMPFAANAVPLGWYLCDGRTWATLGLTAGNALYDLLQPLGWAGLPDLRGRTVIGVGTNNGVTGVLGVVQGVANTTLTSAHIPEHSHGDGTLSAAATGYWPHSHGVNDPGHAHSINATREVIGRASGGSTFGKWDDSGAYRATNGAGTGISIAATDLNHGHDVTGSTGNYGAVSPTAVSAIQPSLPLNYIIKG